MCFIFPPSNMPPTYNMRYYNGVLYIKDDERVYSFSTDNLSKTNRELLENVIAAFLKNNPSGFGQIAHTMLDAYNDPLWKRTSPSKSLVTAVAQIALKLADCSFFGPSIIRDFINDFAPTWEFPVLYVPTSYSETEWVASHYPAPNECWIIELTPENLIKISEKRPDSGIIFVYTCTPDAEKEERILSPNVFMRAMRRFVESDIKLFEEFFARIKTHYDTLPPGWNHHYHQLCLMAYVYKNFESDIRQVATFCPWIDYD